MRDPIQNYAHYAADPGYHKDDNRLKEQRVRWAAARITHYHPKQCLDLGASDGFLAELLPSECEYEGLELNPAAVANAYPHAQVGLRVANADTILLRPHHYECVVAGEILEHLPDPKGFLERCHQALTPRGILITTSALGHGEAHEPGNSEHLREWNVKEYRALHESAGFDIIEQGVLEVYPGRYTNCVLAMPARMGEANERGVRP